MYDLDWVWHEHFPLPLFHICSFPDQRHAQQRISWNDSNGIQRNDNGHGYLQQSKLWLDF